MFERFKKIINDIDVYYAWVEIPEGLLSSAIPRPALAYLHGEDEEGNISRYRTELVDIEVERTDEEGNPYTVTIQKKQKVKQDIEKVTLADFTLQYRPSKNQGKVIITIGACLGDRYRVKPVNDTDLVVWNDYLLPQGFGVDKWLDKSEMVGLLPEEEIV